jgi:hypothetical protein
MNRVGYSRTASNSSGNGSSLNTREDFFYRNKDTTPVFSVLNESRVDESDDRDVVAKSLLQSAPVYQPAVETIVTDTVKPPQVGQGSFESAVSEHQAKLSPDAKTEMKTAIVESAPSSEKTDTLDKPTPKKSPILEKSRVCI